MNKNLWIGGGLIVVALIGGYYFWPKSQSKFGDAVIAGQTTYSNSSSTYVGLTDVVVQATTSRQYCRFTNVATTSSSTIYLSLMGDNPAVASAGIAIPTNVSFQMTNPELSLYRGAIHAIASSTVGTLAWSCI